MAESDRTDPNLSIDALFRIHEICSDFERAWSQNQAPKLEDFLDRVPPSERSALLSHLLNVELEYRRRRGEPCEEAEYADRFPDESSVLVAVFREQEGESDLTASEGSDRSHSEDTGTEPQRSRGDSSIPALAGYDVLSEIARGGMGAVFRVVEGKFRRPLALKVLLPDMTDDALVERFRREALITGQLQHPGIPPVHDQGILDNGLPFFAMKLIEGETLSSLLKKRTDPATDLPHFLSIFGQICQTMAYAHRHGIIHRDLKPSNVMVGAFGEVQVMDWGLAKVLSSDEASTDIQPASSEDSRTFLSSPDHTEHILGTPAYMPPEQARGENRDLDARADVFGLGAILCEILTGKPPFLGGRALTLAKRSAKGDVEDALERLSRCQAASDLIDLAKRCLAPERGERPRDGGIVAHEIERYQAQVRERLRDAELRTAAATAKADAERGRRRVVQLLAVLGAVFLSAIVGAAVWYRGDQLRQEAEATAREAKEQQQLASLTEGVRRGRDEAVRTRDRVHSRLREEGGVRQLANNPKGWQATLRMGTSALDNAEKLWEKADAELDPRLLESIRKLRAQFDDDEEDRLFVLASNRIRDTLYQTLETKYDRARVFAMYRDLFGKAGYDISKEEATDLVTRMSRSPIREHLVAVLDHWAATAPDNKEFRRLMGIAEGLDTNSLRNEVRRAFLSGKAEQVDEIARRFLDDFESMKTLSPQTLYLIGQGLHGRDQEERWLRSSVLVAPDDFGLLFGFGSHLYRRRRNDESAEYFGRALALQKENPLVWSSLGGALLNQGRLGDGLIACRKAVDLDEGLAYSWFNLGNALTESNQHQEAIEACNTGLKIDPDVPQGWVNLGRALWRNKQLDDAVTAFDKAAKLDSEMKEAWANLGGVLAVRKEYELALVAAKKAVALDSKFAKGWVILGNVRAAREETDEAKTAYDKALEIEPTLPEAWNALGSLQCNKLRDYEAGERSFRKALEHRPQFAQAWVNLGIALRKQRRLDQALEAFERGVSLYPEYTIGWTNLGELLVQQKKYDKAIDAFRTAQKTDPLSANPWMNLGSALALDLRRKEAVAAFDKAVGIDPKLALCWVNLGNVLYALKKNERAIVAFEKALEVRPELDPVRHSLAMALFQCGRFREAKTTYQKVIDTLPERHPFHRSARTRLGHCDEAMATAKKVPEVLAGRVEVSEKEHVLLIGFCRRYKRWYRDGAMLCVSLFERDPKKAQEIASRDRFFASCYAILGASSQDARASEITEEERGVLRRQALAWLRLDLTAYRKHMADNREFAAEVADRMESWRTTPDFATVRDEQALAALPEDVRQEWEKLWADAAELERMSQEHFSETTWEGTYTGEKVVHEQALKSRRRYIVSLETEGFDAKIQLLDSEGTELAKNDDQTRRKYVHVRLEFTPEREGTYRIVVSAKPERQRGKYTIRVREFVLPE